MGYQIHATHQETKPTTSLFPSSRGTFFKYKIHTADREIETAYSSSGGYGLLRDFRLMGDRMAHRLASFSISNTLRRS